MSTPFAEKRARELADELTRRNEAGLISMSAADVGETVRALGLKLRDVDPPSPPYDQRSFVVEQIGERVLIIITFKHGVLMSVGVFGELQTEYFI